MASGSISEDWVDTSISSSSGKIMVAWGIIPIFSAETGLSGPPVLKAMSKAVPNIKNIINTVIATLKYLARSRFCSQFPLTFGFSEISSSSFWIVS